MRKLSPRHMVRNPVMFVTEVVAALVTILFVRDFLVGDGAAFSGQIAAWLWFTVLFANFAEAVAEGRGKAQADTLRRTKTETLAKRLDPRDGRTVSNVSALDLKVGDVVLVEAGDVIPGDGDVVEGIASVNEAAITGESAPVIRESGGDRSAVTGGTQVISDWIKVKITSAQGSTFLDRMIALVEGAQRQKTPNEIALNILLAGMTIVFLLATATIESFAVYAGSVVSVVVLVALLVTLIPTTIGGLLSAIGIAGMDRLVKFNVLAKSGRAVEAAGDVDTLLLDKTGTITLGNRMASELVAAPGVTEQRTGRGRAPGLARRTKHPKGARSSCFVPRRSTSMAAAAIIAGRHATFVPFTAQSRMSGIDLDGRIDPQRCCRCRWSRISVARRRRSVRRWCGPAVLPAETRQADPSASPNPAARRWR